MIHKEIEVDRLFTFTLQKFVNAIQIVPDSGTYAVTNNSGGSLQTGAVSIDGEGTMSFIFLAANNTTIDPNFKVLWTWILSGDTTTQVELFDVVKQPIINVVTDTDLYNYLNQLRRKHYTLQGETDSAGTLTTLQDDGLKSDDRNWTGGKVEIFVSDTKVHDANITAFAKSTGIVSFTPAFSSTITANLKYVIRDSYTPYIQTAFDDHIHPTLRKRFGTSSGYLDSNVTKMLIIYKALEIYCFGQIEVEGDLWDIRYQGFKDQYNSKLTGFMEAYDYDEDGNIDGKEEDSKISTFTRSVKR